MYNTQSTENKDVFDIKEKLATGSFGSTIFKAYNPVLGQVAIAKKYPAAITNDYEGFMTILDEVRECRSPQIVGLYGYYKAVKYFWVVMEFCHGYSVFNLMTQLNRPLKESQIRTVLSHVLKGLEALHTRSIVHARVKSSNILITTFGVCKLAEPGPPVTMSDIGVNVDGLVGNAYWTAPEVLLEQGYSIASDIWSLGITAIEMGERQPPYAETHPSRVMVAIPARPPPEFLNPDAWSKSLKAFLSNCLQKNPDVRFSAAQLLSQKIMRKAEYKGMQTIVQKFIKLHQQNSRFYPEAVPKPAKEKKADIPVEDGSWAESGTLVWSPSSSDAGPSSSSTRTTTSTVSKSNLTKADASSARRAQSQPTPSKPSQTNQSQPTPSKPSQTNHRKSKDDINHFAEPSDSTMKKDDLVGLKTKYIEPSDTLPGPGPIQPVPRMSKTSEKSQSNKLPQVPKKKPPSPETIYPDQTVKVKEAMNYTPQYMDFYKDEEPPLMIGEDHESPAQGNLVRRNSIDQRGIRKDKMREELQKNLDAVDMEYCVELENIQQSSLNYHEALLEYIAGHRGDNSTDSTSKPNFYSKLDKLELSLMLKFTNLRHEDVLKTAKEHFDLEHQFLMNALRNTTDMDEEVRYNLSISDNNEMQASTLSRINRQFQSESEEIMRALERINYAAAIAVD